MFIELRKAHAQGSVYVNAIRIVTMEYQARASHPFTSIRMDDGTVIETADRPETIREKTLELTKA